MSCRRRLALVCVAALAFGRRSEALCGLGSADGGADDLVACLKAKAIVAMDRASRADAIPLAGSVALVRDETHRRHREQRSDEPSPPAEQELRSTPDGVLDTMLYDQAVRLFSGRSVRIGLPEVTPGQLKTTLEEGMLCAQYIVRLSCQIWARKKFFLSLKS